MLIRLRIENLALIDQADVVFSDGLTVITGESGAGKSLLIRALALALGERADREDIGSHSDACTVTAEFDLPPTTGAQETDRRVTLRREINATGAAGAGGATGRSRAWVNDTAVSLTELKERGGRMCHILGQSSGMALRDESSQREFLDRYAGIAERALALGQVFDQWTAVTREIEALTRGRERLAHERELALFQRDELESAHLSPAEEPTLIAEKKRLDNAERLMRNCDTLLSAFENDESPLRLLRELRKLAHEISRDDPAFRERQDQLESLTIQIDELRQSVGAYRDRLTMDDERQEILNSRLAELYRIKKKYGGSVETALTRLEELRGELSHLPDLDTRLRELNAEDARLREVYTAEALALRKIRLASAAKLARAVKTELADMAIPHAGFEFMFTWEPFEDGVAAPGRDGQVVFIRPERHGLEGGCFYFSANPGEDLKPLARVASGGELSRALLALHVAIAGAQPADRHATQVYDEVDNGIGGATATAVGKKLAKLTMATGKGDKEPATQVIVVTHLRQVAACGNHHIVVEKSGRKGRNIVTVRALTKSESRAELLRMVDLAPVG